MDANYVSFEKMFFFVLICVHYFSFFNLHMLFYCHYKFKSSNHTNIVFIGNNKSGTRGQASNQIQENYAERSVSQLASD